MRASNIPFGLRKHPSKVPLQPLFASHTTKDAHMRPRERLIQHGPHCLSERELLSLLIQTGNQQNSAEALAERLLNQMGSASAVLQAPVEQFISVPGLGHAKFAAIQAGAELMRRVSGPRKPGDVITHPTDLGPSLRPLLSGLGYEVFGAVFLDSLSRFIRLEVLFRGTLGQTSVYPRELVARCLQLNASRVVIFHNHPSGLAEPSLADLRLTHSLRSLLGQIEIQLWGHLLVAGAQVVLLDPPNG